MRATRWLWLVLASVGCGQEPLCGLDENDDEIPSCTYEATVEGAKVELEFCPGDHWAASDACNSCGCDRDGEVLCTSVVCGG